MNDKNIYNFSISVILTSELNKLKTDNKQMEIRITELLKDKEFYMAQLEKTFNKNTQCF